MTLYIIGLGLSDETDITLKGLEAAKKCKYLYLDNYTSILQCPKEKLEKLIGKEIKLADRTQLENKSAEIIEQAKKDNVALLAAGDALSATTHINFLIDARKAGVIVKVIHNASILTAVAITGLQLYKFGKVTSIPFQALSENVDTPYEVIKENNKNKMHTLVLLDIDSENNKFMSVSEAINILTKKDKKLSKKNIIAAARLGSDNQMLKAGKAEELSKLNFGKPPYCLVIPTDELHFMEEEALEIWK